MRNAALAFAAGLLVLGAPRAGLCQSSEVVVLPFQGSDYDGEVGGLPNYAPREAVAQQFYATHGDSYDFLIVFPTFSADLLPVASGETLGLHSFVQNGVTGINQPIASDAPLFGSASRLHSYIDIATLMPGVEPNDAATTLGVIAHEVCHQWAAYVPFVDPITGATTSSLLGSAQAHWSFFLDDQASVLYGSDWEPVDGGYASAGARLRYSDLDLYLMGFYAPSEVEPFLLLNPVPSVTYSPTDLPPPDGTVIPASPEQVTVDAVIAAAGARSPDSTTAPHDFRAAFILLTGPGQTATPDQIAFVDAVRTQWESEFFLLTRGRGTMETELAEVAPASVASQPSVSAGLAYLLGRQGDGGSWQDASQTVYRDTETALEALALFGEIPDAGAALAAGGAALATLSPGEADATARQTLGLVAAHQPVGPDALGTFADPYASAPSGFGEASGYGQTAIDSILVAQARAASQGPASIALLVPFLLSLQGSDGGWPFLVGGPSRIEPTARALLVLTTVPLTDPVATAVRQGLGLLRAKEQSNGTYLDDQTSPAATALALLARNAWSDFAQGEAATSTAALLAMQEADGSWNEEVAATALALQALRTLLVPNLVIAPADVTLSSSAVPDGQPVTATVTIHNTGSAEADGVLLQAFDSNGLPFDVPAGPVTVAAGSSVAVTLTLDTTGHAGSTQAFFVVNPTGSVDETSTLGNRAAVPLVVSPISTGPTLFATSVSASPAAVTQLPETVAVTATVGNAGQTDAPGVEVVLEEAGTVVATATVDLPARSSQSITLTATIASASGSVPLAVVVDPLGLVAGANEAQNTALVTLPVVATTELVVSNVEVTPSSVDQGQLVQLSYLVSNTGTTPASGANSQVTIATAAGVVIATLPPQSANLAAGQSATVTQSYAADTAGVLTVTATATYLVGGALTGTSASTSVDVISSPLVNLRLAPGSLTIAPSPPDMNGAATLTALVANTGGSASPPFTVAFYTADPASGATPFAQAQVGSIPAGGSAPATASYTPSSTAPITFVAFADPTGQVTELDRSDNETTLTVTPLSLPDLAVGPADLTTSPAFPQQGQSVTVSLSVLNQGGQPALNVPVAFFLGSAGAGGTALGTVTLPQVAAGSRQVASLTYTPTSQGTVTLVAVVNPTQSVVESNYANDQTQTTLTIQSANLALSYPYFSPNHDGVQDTTTLFYRLSQPAPVTAQIGNASGTVVRTLSAPAGPSSLVWDGTDTTGNVVPDGPYTIAVTSSSTPLGSVIATVDTNRSPFSSALGGSLLSTLSAPAGAFGGAITPNDSALYGTDVQGDLTVTTPGVGTVVLIAGTPAERFLGEPTVSPTTQEIFAYSSLGGVRGYQPATQTLRTVVSPGVGDLGFAQFTTTSISDAYDLLLPIRVSSDGSTLAVAIYNRPATTIATVDTTSLAITNLASFDDVLENDDTNAPLQFVGDYQFSPDGTEISVLYTDQIWLAFTNGSPAVEVVPSGLIEPAYPLGQGTGLHGWSADGKRLLYVVQGTPNLPQGYAACAETVCGPPSDTDQYLNCITETAPWLPVPTGCYNGFTGAGIGATDVATRAQSMLYTVPGVDLGGYPYGSFSTQGAVIADNPTGDGVAFAAGFSSSIPFLHPSCNEGCELSANLAPIELQLLPESGGTPAPIFQSAGTSTHLGWSTSGKTLAAAYSADGPTSSQLFSSAANLTVGLSATKPPNGTALVFRGTAEDLNFASWQLALAPLGQPPVILADSATPAVQSTLLTYVPPAPGLYEVTLTAADLAGNTATAEREVAWPASPPALTNFTVSNGYLSPNGDGVLDTVTVSYTANEPVSGEVDVMAADGGPVLRRLPINALTAGPGSVVWNGTDDEGMVVPDGPYDLLGDGAILPVIVDTLPPAIQLGGTSSAPFVTMTAASFPAELSPTTVPVPVVWSDGGAVGDGGSTAQLAEGLATEAWLVSDLNLLPATVVADPTATVNAVYLEESNWAGTTPFELVASAGTEPYFLPGSLAAVLGSDSALFEHARVASGRVVAVDLAGNTGTSSVFTHPEVLQILAAGPPPTDALEPPGLVADGTIYPRLDALPAAPVLTTGAVSLFSPPGFIDLVLDDTISESFASVTVLVRPHDTGGPSQDDSARVTILGRRALQWDMRLLQPGMYDGSVHVTDAIGRTFDAAFILNVPITAAMGQCDAVAQGSTGEELIATVGLPLDAGLVGTVQVFEPDGGSADGGPEAVGSPVVFSFFTGGWTSVIPVGDLPTCAHWMTFVGTDGAGHPVQSEGPVDLCGVHNVGREFQTNGGWADVEAGQTYREPVSAMELVSGFPFASLGPATPLTEATSVAPGPVCAGGLATFQYDALDLTGDPLPAHPNFAACEPNQSLCGDAGPDESAFLDAEVVSQIAPVPCEAARAAYTLSVQARSPVAPLATLSVSVVGPNGPVSLPDLGFTPGQTFATSIPLSLADGTYHVEASATLADQSFVTNGAKATSFTVASLPPGVSVSSPMAGQDVCASPFMGSINLPEAFAVQGTATGTEAPIESVALSLTGPGAKASSEEVVGPPNFQLEAPAFTGSQSATVIVTDSVGNQACATVGPFNVHAGATVGQVVALPALVSSNPALAEQLQIFWSQADSATDSLDLVTPAGTLVANLGLVALGAGLQSQAVPIPTVSDGLYEARVTATDQCGHVSAGFGAVTLDSTPPVVQVTSPSLAQSPVGSSIPVTGVVSDQHLASWSLGVAPGQQTTGLTQVASGTTAVNGQLGTLTNLSPGPYTLVLSALDGAGNSSQTTQSFTLQPPAAISSLTATPPLFSPNGDGVLDTSLVQVALTAPATTSLVLIDSSQNLLATLLAPTALNTGTSLVVDAQAVATVPDGDYLVQATAVSAGGQTQATAPLDIERAGPDAGIVTPATGAFVAGSTPVVLRIADRHLTAWTLSGSGPSFDGGPLTTGTGAPPVSPVALLAGLADGPYSLSLVAEDGAGNSSTATSMFVSDSTPPVVTLTAPDAGAYVSGLLGPVPVMGTATDVNLAQVQLEVGAGSPPASLATVVTLAAVPDGGLVDLWDPTTVADGPTTLELLATDKAGNTGQASVPVTVDDTPPVAQIASPRGGYLQTAAPVVSGTASDLNFATYEVAIAEGTSPLPGAFAVVASGSAPVVGGDLVTFPSLPADGVYTAQLTVTDLAGNVSTDTSTFTVDSVPPPAPTLTATLVPPNSVSLSWTASPDPSVTGYQLVRALGSGALAPVTAAPIPSPPYLDPALADGTYTYEVIAESASGLASAPSNAATVTIDATPPVAVILSPAPGSEQGGVVQVTGTATAVHGVARYQLLLGAGASPSTWQPVGGGTVAVIDGLLGAFSTTNLAQGSTQSLSLQVLDLQGRSSSAQVTFTVDNLPPSAPVLISVAAQGVSVLATWQPNPETDLLGYLIYRNGALANAPAGADVTNAEAYLLPVGTTSYLDPAPPDGTMTYQVQAVDVANNFSALSNALSITVDNQPPTAAIANPVALQRLPGPTPVSLTTTGLNIASIQLMARSGTGAFAPYGAPLTQPPYASTFDPSGFPNPVLELEAVATDQAGRTDPSPVPTLIFFDPTLSPVVFSAVASGNAADLTWTDPNPPGEVVGVAIDRDGASIDSPTRPAAASITASSSLFNTEPSLAYDQNPATAWSAAGPAPQTWEVDFTHATLVDGISFQAGIPSTATVSLEVDGVWVPLVTGITMGSQALPVSPPLWSSGLRFTFTQVVAQLADLEEVELATIGLSAAPPVVDPGLDGGAYAYAAVAYSAFGQAVVSADAGVAVDDPYLDPVPPVVESPSVTIAGHQGYPGGSVQWVVDGASGPTTAADDGGGFALPLTLAAGVVTTVSAVLSDGTGDTSARTNAVSTLYAAALFTLALDGVDGGEVALSFSASGDTAGLAGGELFRTPGDGGPTTDLGFFPGSSGAPIDGPLAAGTYAYDVVPQYGAASPYLSGPASNVVIATVTSPPNLAPVLVLASQTPSSATLTWTLPAGSPAPSSFTLTRSGASGTATIPLSGTTLSYVDSLAGAGTFTYTVAAVYADGSAFVSNAVQVVLASGALTLAVAAPAVGSELELTWSAVPGATGYNVSRQGPDGGGLAVLNPAPVWRAAYFDVGLTNGLAYTYEVTALGTGTAESLTSAPVTATPADALVPTTPVITQPTVAGSPIVVSTTQTVLGGLIDSDAVSVDVIDNGTDGGTQAVAPAIQPASLNLYDTPYDALNDWPFFDSSPFAVSPDGTEAAYSEFPDGSGHTPLVIQNLTTGAQVFSTNLAMSLEFSTLAFSPDGTELVGAPYVNGASPQVVVIDAVTGVATQLTFDETQSAANPTWSPDGRTIAFNSTSNSTRATTVELVDPVSGALDTQHVFAADGPAYPLLWMADGQTLIGNVNWDEIQLYSLPTLAIQTFPIPQSVTGLAVSPNAMVAAMTVYPDLLPTQMLYLVTPTGVQPVLSAGTACIGAVFSEDGSQIWFESGTDIDRYALATGAITSSPSPDAIQGELFPVPGGVDLLDSEGLGVFEGLAQASFTLPPTTLVPGSNVLTVRSQRSEGPPSAPAAPIDVSTSISVSQAYPDLAASLQLEPAIPIAGQAATAYVTVSNVGGQPAAAFAVQLQLLTGDGGVTSYPWATLPGLAPGASSVAPFALDLAGLSGPAELAALADPADAVPDPNRANNTVTLAFVIAASAAPQLSVTASPPTVGYDGTVSAAVTVSNPGPSEPVDVAVALTDLAGNLVASGAPDAVYAPLASEQIATFSRAIGVGSALAGSYLVTATATANGAVVATASTPVSVTADDVVTLTLVPNQASYGPADPIALSGEVTNGSPNAFLVGASFALQISNAAGAVLAQSQTALSVLATGASVPLSPTFPPGTLPPGSYTATGTVTEGGVVLATATAPIAVAGASALSGTLAVANGAGAPPAVPLGTPAQVAITAVNGGSTSAPAVSLLITALDPQTQAVVGSANLTAGDLAPGAAFQGQVTLPTAGLALKTYALALQATSAGATTLLATSSFTLVDGQPPSLALLNLTNGMFVQANVEVEVAATDTASGVASVFAESDTDPAIALGLDAGSLASGVWTGLVPLSVDGSHTLTIWGVNGAGFSGLKSPMATDPLTVTVIRDSVPPVITLGGFTSGELVATPVTPTYSATDLHLASVSATLNGAPFASGTSVTVDGSYTLLVEATDLAGNVATAQGTFAIDQTPPVIAIAGVVNGEYVNQSVTPIVLVSDPHLASEGVTLNGAPFTSGTVVSIPGAYTLVVNAADSLGNASSATLAFVIDETPPMVTLGGFADGGYYSTPVTPTFTATDPYLASVEALLNGNDLDAGTAVTAAGSYAYEVVATDLAGNETDVTGYFTIDYTAPSIAIAQTPEGAAVAPPVELAFSVADTIPFTSSATLDGTAVTSPVVVTTLGEHTLVVSAVNAAGVPASESDSFTVTNEAAPPTVVLTATGTDGGPIALDGGVVDQSVVLTYQVTDSSAVTVVALLDGQSFSSGTVVSAPGLHSAAVTATDGFGNSTTASGSFVIDETPPAITLLATIADGGLVPLDGGFANQPVAVSFAVSDSLATTVDAGINGAPLTSGEVFTEQGSYAISVQATDLAGNASAVTGAFTIDTTPPAIAITGVTTGAQYDHAVAITFSESDAHPGPISATLNGSPLSSPASVTSAGAYTLVVVATDLAGNSSEETVSFILDFTPPVLTVAGVSPGGLYGHAVTPTASATDNVTPSAQIAISATLNGSAFTLGDPVSANGTYTLVVTATDLAGNSTQVTDAFTVDTTPPTLSITGVTNGEVSTQPVTPVVTVTDPHPGTVTLMLNGSPFASGTTVSAPGSYTLSASATNALGVTAGPVTVDFVLGPTMCVVPTSDPGPDPSQWAPWPDGGSPSNPPFKDGGGYFLSANDYLTSESVSGNWATQSSGYNPDYCLYSAGEWGASHGGPAGTQTWGLSITHNADGSLAWMDLWSDGHPDNTAEYWIFSITQGSNSVTIQVGPGCGQVGRWTDGGHTAVGGGSLNSQVGYCTYTESMTLDGVTTDGQYLVGSNTPVSEALPVLFYNDGWSESYFNGHGTIELGGNLFGGNASLFTDATVEVSAYPNATSLPNDLPTGPMTGISFTGFAGSTP